ncbi:SPOR domain-containing protein [Erythrobacter alti]|uniref:SPOR domain-containing protein n=1 Tax=Erythrobacter alti TaxID=1896145 RepID=UPI0030F3C9D8
MPDKARFAALNRVGLTVLCIAGLSACAAAGGNTRDSNLASASVLQSTSNGPAADYPIIIGAPYSIGGTEYVPRDALNYDHVGYITTDAGAMGYSGAHHTLPVPSYVEVTSLESGRTVLVRLERRGPMNSNHLIALSPAAMAQLGANEETPIRMRRVNPPEVERFALRGGDAAPLRMDTPQSLLTVLQRRLPASGAASLRSGSNTAQPSGNESAIEAIELAASQAPQAPMPEVGVDEPMLEAAPVLTESTSSVHPQFEGDASGAPEPTRSDTDFAEAFEPGSEAAPVTVRTPAAEGNFVVQAAAFSTVERAERAADALGGQVTQAGRYFRVRTGPFVTRGEAEASLANVRRAGYSDARILTSG